MQAIVKWLLARGIKIGIRFVTIEPTGIKKLKYGVDVKGVPDAWVILTVSAANCLWQVQVYSEVL